MKTPREILLQRHQAADAKLNQVRREVIAQMEKPPVARTEWLPLCALLTLWRELIWPARRIWAGLAATWVFILIANANLSQGRPVASAEKKAQSAELWRMFHEQNQLIAELSGAAETETAAPPVLSAPRPRSEVGSKWMTI